MLYQTDNKDNEPPPPPLPIPTRTNTPIASRTRHQQAMLMELNHSDRIQSYDTNHQPMDATPHGSSLLDFLRDTRSPESMTAAVSDPRAIAMQLSIPSERQSQSQTASHHMHRGTSEQNSDVTVGKERGDDDSPRYDLHRKRYISSAVQNNWDDISPRNTSTSASNSTSTSTEPLSEGGGGNVKRSRYLRESDRRAIIRRIENGEKQAALAKEYGVTRAAICHINKNRVEILTRSVRVDVHSAARHPKRGLYTTSKSMSQHHGLVDEHVELPMVYEVRSHAMALLMTSLRRKETPSYEFKAHADRSFVLLIEEALGCVPTRTIEIIGSGDYLSEGLVAEQPSCGISLGENGFAMLQVFRSIQPHAPTGFLMLSVDNEDNPSDPVVQRLCLPMNILQYNILLLEPTCASGVSVCVVIDALMQCGVKETSIYLVCLVTTVAVVSQICDRFPAVHIITGAIDPEVVLQHGICPGVGNFAERYFNTIIVHHQNPNVGA